MLGYTRENWTSNAARANNCVPLLCLQGQTTPNLTGWLRLKDLHIFFRSSHDIHMCASSVKEIGTQYSYSRKYFIPLSRLCFGIVTFCQSSHPFMCTFICLGASLHVIGPNKTQRARIWREFSTKISVGQRKLSWGFSKKSCMIFVLPLMEGCIIARLCLGKWVGYLLRNLSNGFHMVSHTLDTTMKQRKRVRFLSV